MTSTKATFGATINPNNESTTYAFEYATTEAALLGGTGTTVAGGTPLEGYGEQPITVPTVAALAPGTTYFYRVEATNATGTSYGTMQSFTTVPAPTAEAPAPIGAETATLNGKLTSLNKEVPTGYWFEYAVGATCAGGTETTHESTLTASGAKAVSAVLAALQPNATYAVCLVASNSFGSETSAPVSFKTLAAPPKVEGESTSGVKATEATLDATINPNNQEVTECEFQYGTEASLATSTTLACEPPTPYPAEYGGKGVSVPTGAVLAPGTTYYYRVVTKNVASEEAKGPVQSFTTVPAPATEAPNPIGAETATFKGILTPLNKNVVTQYSFDYALVPSKCNEGTSAGGEAGKGSGVKAVSAEVGGLEPNAEYAVCLVSSNEFGSEIGTATEKVFKTLAAPPKIDGESAPVVNATKATLEAQVNPNNEKTKYTFEYSTTENGHGVLTGTILKQNGLSELPAAFGDQSASVSVTGLKAGETYYYRVVAENKKSEEESKPVVFPVQSFTAAAAPIIVANSESVTANYSPIEATFSAAIDPNGEVTAYEFEYATSGAGLGTAAATTIPVAELLPAVFEPAGLGVSVSTGPVLEPGQVYYYRAIAENETGRKLGEVKELSKAPIAESEGISGLTETGVTLEATVNPYFQPTMYAFEYSTSKAAVEAGAGTTVAGANTLPAVFEGQPASVQLTSLNPGETYYYRVLAENETTKNPGNKAARLTGEVQSFTTLRVPVLSTGEVQSIAPTSAILTGTVNPGGVATAYHFAYIGQAGYEAALAQSSPNPYALGFSTPAVAVGSDHTVHPVTAPLEELKPETTYHYALVATNALGTTIVGPGQTFTTAPGEPPAPPTPAPSSGETTPPAAAPPAALPSLSYPTIAELDAQEAKEGKGASAGTGTKTLTNAEKLSKALKACKKEKQSKRAKCEKQAHGKYGSAKKKKK